MDGKEAPVGRERGLVAGDVPRRNLAAKFPGLQVKHPPRPRGILTGPLGMGVVVDRDRSTVSRYQDAGERTLGQTLKVSHRLGRSLRRIVNFQVSTLDDRQDLAPLRPREVLSVLQVHEIREWPYGHFFLGKMTERNSLLVVEEAVKAKELDASPYGDNGRRIPIGTNGRPLNAALERVSHIVVARRRGSVPDEEAVLPMRQESRSIRREAESMPAALVSPVLILEERADDVLTRELSDLFDCGRAVTACSVNFPVIIDARSVPSNGVDRFP